MVELVVVRDKVTHDSKGSAFVWYQSRADADRAALQLNVRHVLPDPWGERDWPLVVRRANTRKSVTAAAAATAQAQAQAQQQVYGGAYAVMAGGQVAVPAQAQAVAMQPLSGSNAILSGTNSGTLVGLEPVGMVGGLPGHGHGGVPGDMGPPMQLQPMMLQASPQQLQSPGQQLVYHPVMAGGPGPGEPHSGHHMTMMSPVSPGDAGRGGGGDGGSLGVMRGSYPGMGDDGGGGNGGAPSSSNNVLTAMCGGPPMVSGGSTIVSSSALMSGGSAMISGANSAAAGNSDRIASIGPGGRVSSSGGGGPGGGGVVQHVLQVPLSSGHMAAITSHVFSIQTMSGAEVTSQAVGPGVFCLVLKGSKLQIETANQLIASVLQNITA